MKKQKQILNLSSMPKMVLVVTVIVMLGTLFGAVSYLLKTPKTDLPIVNPVVETKIGEVVITTDKMEYEQGEEVKIIIENNSDQEQKISSPPYVVEKFENDNWVEVKQVWCPCNGFCYDAFGPLSIKSKDKLEHKWNQQESWCSDRSMPSSKEISNQVQLGRYRIKSIKINLDDKDNKQTIYSNEFTIKEKSAFDARCGEKVEFDNFSCPLSRIINGYEFDTTLNKCKEVEVYGGCDFKTPFESLEECREVCENELDTSDWQIYRNEEFGFEFKYPEECFLKEPFDKRIYLKSEMDSYLAGRIISISIKERIKAKVKTNDSFPSSEYMEFVIDEMIKSCFASRTGGGMDIEKYCIHEYDVEPFLNMKGTMGYKIYITEIIETVTIGKTTTEERRKGPIFVFDISDQIYNKCLFFQLVDETEKNLKEETHSKILNQILFTFKFTEKEKTK